jgi:hypothetical protein
LLYSKCVSCVLKMTAAFLQSRAFLLLLGVVFSMHDDSKRIMTASTFRLTDYIASHNTVVVLVFLFWHYVSYYDTHSQKQ